MDENVNVEKIVMDTTNADIIVDDLIMHLNAMKKSLTNIYNLMNKALNTSLNNEYKNTLGKLAVSIQKQASMTANNLNSLKTKYKADTVEYTIDVLEKRIEDLENKIVEIEGLANTIE